MVISGCGNKNTELYIDYIRQFDESIQIIQKDNNFICQQFVQANFDNPARTKRWLANVNKIKQKRIELSKFIDSLQNELDTGVVSKIIQSKNREIDLPNHKVSLNLADIDFLKKEMDAYKDSLNTFIFDHEKYDNLIKAINSSLNTDSITFIPVFNSKPVSLAEAIACLMKIKTEIILAETNFLNYSYSQIDAASCFKFYKIEALVVPNSQILLVGYPYKAEIYLTSVDTTLNYFFRIEGKQYETRAGVGQYEFKVIDEPGIYCKKGNFFYINPVDGEIHNYPFKIEYEVIARK